MLSWEAAQAQSVSHEKRQMGKLKVLLICVAWSVLYTCGVDEYFDNLMPRSEVEFSQHYVHKVLSQDFEYVKSVSDTIIGPFFNGGQMMRVLDTLMVGDMISSMHFNSYPVEFDGEIKRQYMFEVHYPYQWWLVTVVVSGEKENLLVTGFQITKAEDSQLELTRFRLKNRPNTFYILLGYHLIATIFIFVTLIIAISTKFDKRKWLWVLMILVAYGDLTVNWATGEYTSNLLTLRTVPGGLGTMGIYDSWYLSTLFPIGALLFWVKWYRMRNPKYSPEEDKELAE